MLRSPTPGKPTRSRPSRSEPGEGSSPRNIPRVEHARPPFQLFLVANLLFFAIQSLMGWNTFSTPLRSHLDQQVYSPVAQRLVMRHLDVRQITIESYAPVFNNAVALHAKSLVILMVPPRAILTLVLFQWSRRPFVAHFVFALHFYAFLLVLVSLLLPLGTLAAMLGISSSGVDGSLALVQSAISAVYLYVAAGTVYGVTGVSRFVRITALVAAVACIWLGYRFALLFVTLYST